MSDRFIELVSVLMELRRSKGKLDPKAKVRNRGTVVFPANSKKVKNHKDHFPINNANQARNALSRVAQYSSVPSWYSGSLKELQSAVRSAVSRKYKDIHVTKADDGGTFSGPQIRYGGGQVPDKKKRRRLKMAINDLNPGFKNNINIAQIRTSGSSMQRVTDKAIDFNGDGVKEKVVITNISGDAVGTPSAPGGKIVYTTNGGLLADPAGTAHSVIEQTFENDGGKTLKGSIFTQGIS